MVFGFCMGGAMAVAMACDFRFAAEGRSLASRRQAQHLYGLDPVHQLVDLVGPAYAKDILYSGRALDDQEALRIGLIQRLVPADDLEKAHLRLPPGRGRQRAAVHPRHEGSGPGHLRRHHRGASGEAPGAGHRNVRERRLQGGTRAFLEKRSPRFQGR